MNKEKNVVQTRVFAGRYLEPDVKSVKVKTGMVICTSESLYGGFTNGEQEGN